MFSEYIHASSLIPRAGQRGIEQQMEELNARVSTCMPVRQLLVSLPLPPTSLSTHSPQSSPVVEALPSYVGSYLCMYLQGLGRAGGKMVRWYGKLLGMLSVVK